jgi:hypothetical protein
VKCVTYSVLHVQRTRVTEECSLTCPPVVSSCAIYSSNHSLTPCSAVRTSATAVFEPVATFARMFNTSSLVS